MRCLQHVQSPFSLFNRCCHRQMVHQFFRIRANLLWIVMPPRLGNVLNGLFRFFLLEILLPCVVFSQTIQQEAKLLQCQSATTSDCSVPLDNKIPVTLNRKPQKRVKLGR